MLILRSVQGALLSFGAPMGWLVIRWFQGADLWNDFINNPILYSYMLFGTMIVFSIFGCYTGYHEKKLEEKSIAMPSLFKLSN